MSQPRISQTASDTVGPGATSRRKSSAAVDPSNVMSIAGLAFCLIAAVLYGLLFYMVYQLPSEQLPLESIRNNTPTLLKLVMIASCGGLLNLVALALCLYGLIQSQFSSRLSIIGIALSTLLLIAIPTVIVIGGLA